MIISGAYDSNMGGRIYLNLAENLIHESMAATYFHETGHAWLDGTTVLGVLRNVLQMEALASEETDQKHCKNYKLCARMLTERTRFVQEVFANNLELLMLEDRFGEEEMLRALRDRPEEYQAYYTELWPVNHSGQPVGKRIEQVAALCAYAMNVPLPSWAEVNPEFLAGWLSGEEDLTQRLSRAVRAYQEQGVLPEQELDEEALWRFAEEAVVYARPYVQEAAANFDKVVAELFQESAGDFLNRQMMNKVCLFDPAILRPLRVPRLPDWEKGVPLILKQVGNLQGEENFYLITYSEREKGYLSAEVTPAELNRGLSSCLSACVLWSEYGQGVLTDLCGGQDPLTVLIRTNEECGSG